MRSLLTNSLTGNCAIADGKEIRMWQYRLIVWGVNLIFAIVLGALVWLAWQTGLVLADIFTALLQVVAEAGG